MYEEHEKLQGAKKIIGRLLFLDQDTEQFFDLWNLIKLLGLGAKVEIKTASVT